VVTAANGRAALEVFRQQQPRLEVLDLMLPELDGFALLRILCEDTDRANVTANRPGGVSRPRPSPGARGSHLAG
jgi:CheY-like chemotaxis protein